MNSKLFFFALLFPMLAFAQGQISVASLASEYDKLWAKNEVKTWQTEKLKAQVKTCVVIDEKQDSSFYFYNKKGQLQEIRSKQFNTVYEFDNANRLRQIAHTAKNHQPSETRFFNSKGFLSKIEGYYKEYENKFNYKIDYEYNDGKKELKQNFDYTPSRAGYDYVKYKRFVFKFDAKTGLVSQQTETTQMTESTYTDNTSYEYVQVAGRYLMSKVGHYASCFGSNSCLGLQGALEYDKNGNIIAESLQDFTVRNSLWSHSYGKKYKYDENNLLIAESTLYNGRDGSRIDYKIETEAKPPKFDHTFEYEHDKKGNWIVQKMISQTDTKPKVVKTTRRQIVYY